MKRVRVLLLLTIYTSFASATVFTVGVGKDETTGRKGVGFDPSVIVPASGDQIVFEFRSGVHSVVESTFDQPCTPKPGGFNSGVQTVPDNLDVDAPGLPTVTLAVNDSKSLWFFDQAAGTCNQGGVLAVNPEHGSGSTAAAFKENARTATMAPTNPASTSSSPSNTGASSVPSSTQNVQRPTTANAAAAMAASQVALSSVAGIMAGIAMGML